MIELNLSRFDTKVKQVLLKAGWFDGREVSELVSKWEKILKKSDSWEIFPKAKEALQEFGGLEFIQRGEGINVARESFNFNPLYAKGERWVFEINEKELDIELYPLGEASDGYYYLGMDKKGKVYVVGDNIKLVGNNIDIAVENLILGIMP